MIITIITLHYNVIKITLLKCLAIFFSENNIKKKDIYFLLYYIVFSFLFIVL